MSKIIASKKNRENVIFNLPEMTEQEAIKHAKDHMRRTVKNNLKKRLWG